MSMYEKIIESAEFIQSKIQLKPKIGLILGSGLGVYVDSIQDKVIIPYEEIPHFHQTTVEGHQGRLIIGKINGIAVAALQGRYHAYEGHDMETVVLPTRVLAMLGCEFLILTNAAGGINNSYKPGQLVALSDHINLTGKNPLVGPNINQLGPRFPDMTEAYDIELRSIMKDVAKEIGFTLNEGVYCSLLGPTYETPAEIRMLGLLGSDMVGMSTVPESIAANHLGIRVIGISCITNMAAGISLEKLDHSEVKEVAGLATEKFTALLDGTIEAIGKLPQKQD
ncbi:purine-nucleoside phosphorylase [Bacteriovoracaceae bacterium]|nr:purine-nucleoside phosphorylase [Bacteriovoracaceae bacterium]